MDDSELQELMQQARAGEHAAFDALQKALELPLRRFVRRLVGAVASEEDIVQDVFLSLYLNLGHISSVEHLRPFLYRVARNRCYDILRRHGRFEHQSFDEEVPPEAPPANSLGSPPDAVLAQVMIWHQVQAAMARLPEMQRQALILYGLEGLAYEQVAEATGADLGTVKSRIHYARKRLRQLLGPRILEELGVAGKE